MGVEATTLITTPLSPLPPSQPRGHPEIWPRIKLQKYLEKSGDGEAFGVLAGGENVSLRLTQFGRSRSEQITTTGQIQEILDKSVIITSG